MQMRFDQLSTGKIKVGFTGRPEKSHLLSRSHYKYAVRFASQIPYDKILDDVPGWDSNASNVTFDRKKCMVLAKSRYDNIVDKRESNDDAANAELVERAVKEMEDMRGRSDEDIASNIVELVANTVKNEYLAVWKSPDDANIVTHAKLREWLGESLRTNGIKPSVPIDVDFVVPCCSLCNDIWDCWARMRQVLAETDIVPIGAIRVNRFDSKTTATPSDKVTIPVSSMVPRYKSTHQARLGCLAGYYLHGALKSLVRLRDPTDPNDTDHANLRNQDPLRPLVSMLLWLPMHIACMRYEFETPGGATTKKASTKGSHNYLGNLDLMISYYLWLCARSDPLDDGSISFGKFSTVYIRELVGAPPPVWNYDAHKKLSDFIFDDGCPGSSLDLVRQRVSYISDRLVTLYIDVVKPLLPYMRIGSVVDRTMPPAFQEAATAYFISGVECKSFMHNYDPNANKDEANIRYFINFTGSLLLWQNARYLENEDQNLQVALQTWIWYKRDLELRQCVFHFSDYLDKYQADLLYNLQFALWPERILGPQGVMGSGQEVALLDSVSSDDIREFIDGMEKCSLWKAALRQRRMCFTSLVNLSVLNNGDATDGMQMDSRFADIVRKTESLLLQPASSVLLQPMRSLLVQPAKPLHMQATRSLLVKPTRSIAVQPAKPPLVQSTDSFLSVPFVGRAKLGDIKRAQDGLTGDFGRVDSNAATRESRVSRSTATAAKLANKTPISVEDARELRAHASGRNAISVEDARELRAHASGSNVNVDKSLPKLTVNAEDARLQHAHASERDINVYCALAADSVTDPTLDDSSLDSLSARLISAKLDMTPARSAALVAHGAGCGGATRAARRRGCSGRG
jgi:hypothetical protein